MCWDCPVNFFVLLLYELDRVTIFNDCIFSISEGRVSRTLCVITPLWHPSWLCKQLLAPPVTVSVLIGRKQVLSFLSPGFKNQSDPPGIPDLSIARISKILFFTVYHYVHCLWKLKDEEVSGPWIENPVCLLSLLVLVFLFVCRIFKTLAFCNTSQYRSSQAEASSLQLVFEDRKSSLVGD